MGQKTNVLGIRLSFMQQNFFIRKRFKTIQKTLYNFIFDFTTVQNVLVFGQRLSQFFLIERLLVFYLLKLECVLNQVYFTENAFGVLVYVEFFQKDFKQTARYLVGILLLFQKHVETVCLRKKSIQMCFLVINKAFSTKPALNQHLRGKLAITNLFEPLFLFVSLSCYFPAAPVFVSLLAQIFERNIKHALVLEKVSQFLFLIVNIELSPYAGVRFHVKGRLNGIDRSKKETLVFGTVPLQRISLLLSYGFSTAKTPYGVCGLKVWFNFKRTF